MKRNKGQKDRNLAVSVLILGFALTPVFYEVFAKWAIAIPIGFFIAFIFLSHAIGKKKKKDEQHQYTSVHVDKCTYLQAKEKFDAKKQDDGVGMGVCYGMVFGALFDNIALGLAIGILLGMLWDWYKSKEENKKG